MKHLHRYLALALALGGISAGIAPDASAHSFGHSFKPSFKHHSFKPKHFGFIESHPGFRIDHGIRGRKFLVVPKSSGFGHFDDLRGDHHFKRRVPDRFRHFDGSRVIIIVH